MKGKRIKVILNPDRSNDRRILDYLLYAGSSQSQAIKTAVLFYLDNLDGKNKTDLLLQQVKNTIRESVQGLQFKPAADNEAASPSATDDDMVSALDFLDELEGGPF